MWRFVSDENFNNILIHRLRQQYSQLDLVRVQDVGLLHASDPTILDWAAKESRILLTHDLATMPTFAYIRISNSLPMPGVFAMHENAPQDLVFEDLTTIIEDSNPDEWKNKVSYLPL